MIIDSLKNREAYYCLNPYLKQAFDYILSHDLLSYPAGRYEVDENIYVMMSDVELKQPQDAPLEVHDRYLDIQMVLEGEETFGWSERSELRRPRAPFDATKDVQFHDDAPATFFTLRAGQFCIVLPQDGHAPMIGKGRVKKCIVKVRMA